MNIRNTALFVAVGIAAYFGFLYFLYEADEAPPAPEAMKARPEAVPRVQVQIPVPEASGAKRTREPKAEHAGEFDIVGTWEAQDPEQGKVVRYRFAPGGTVTALSRDASGRWTEAGRSTFLYRLDDFRAPTLIEFMEPGGTSLRGSIPIIQYDAGSFTTVNDPNAPPMRWTRVDPKT